MLFDPCYILFVLVMISKFYYASCKILAPKEIGHLIFTIECQWLYKRKVTNVTVVLPPEEGKTLLIGTSSGVVHNWSMICILFFIS